MKYLPLFHHFKAIYQFLKHIIFLVKIVANAPLNIIKQNKKKSKAQICMNINGSKNNFPKILPVQNITAFLISWLFILLRTNTDIFNLPYIWYTLYKKKCNFAGPKQFITYKLFLRWHYGLIFFTPIKSLWRFISQQILDGF